jgi:hypothetical protein
MNATQRVAMRLDEHRSPVERVVEVLRADERVAAAALTSSYARGEADGLSDLDLLVGVLDAHAGEFAPARGREVDPIAAVGWCFITVAGHPVDAVAQEDRHARPGPLEGAEQALPVGDLEDRSPGRRQRRARPLPIGAGQTISQPAVVARMSSLVRPRRDMRVLEVGTGSGCQAAVLDECVREVDTIEIVPELGRRA